jgi:hypothetical protein
VCNKKFDLLELEYIADDIEDVSKSEQGELASQKYIIG